MSYSNLSSLFGDIATQIRLKKGTSELISAQDFPSEIASISGSSSAAQIYYGSATIVSQQQQNAYDPIMTIQAPEFVTSSEDLASCDIIVFRTLQGNMNVPYYNLNSDFRNVIVDSLYMKNGYIHQIGGFIPSSSISNSYGLIALGQVKTLRIDGDCPVAAVYEQAVDQQDVNKIIISFTVPNSQFFPSRSFPGIYFNYTGSASKGEYYVIIIKK